MFKAVRKPLLIIICFLLKKIDKYALNDSSCSQYPLAKDISIVFRHLKNALKIIPKLVIKLLLK